MKAIKIYSNNAVSTLINNKEAILIGPGIGFGLKPGNDIDPKRIEKKYYIQDSLQTKFLQLLDEAKPEALRASELILKHALEEGLSVKNQLIISLTDHISFAMERLENDIELPYLMLNETKLLYPKEFEIGCWAIELLNKEFNIKLPKYEAGYIALQLTSSSMDRNTSYMILKMVNGIFNIVSETYSIDMNDDEIDTMRLSTHLKFLAQRIFSKAQWEEEQMPDLYEMLLKYNSKNQECINKISTYIEEQFKYTINSQEKVYLLVHINKIIKKGV
ncbi:MAG: PRD domain-containing protein [Erysipelotrichaceae bacterium]|nr:PRD domain-containing protein [Erysipelotrichaceae bacterium]